MIKMNFADELKSTETLHLDGGTIEKKSKNWLGLVAALVVVCGGAFYFLTMEEEAPAPVVTTKKATKTTSKSPKPSSEKVGASTATASAAQTNADNLPEKVEKPKKPVGPAVPIAVVSSNESLQRFLAGILSKTPATVGFNDISLQAPNYFYVRGLAQNKKDLKLTKSAVSKVVNSVEKTLVKPQGIGGIAQDFTLYGTMLTRKGTHTDPLTNAQRKRALSDTEKLLAKYSSGASKLKTKGQKKLPRTLKESFSFSSKMTCTRFRNFVSTMAKKKIPVHIEISQLSVGQDEDMNLSLVLSLYSEIESKN